MVCLVIQVTEAEKIVTANLPVAPLVSKDPPVPAVPVQQGNTNPPINLPARRAPVARLANTKARRGRPVVPPAPLAKPKRRPGNRGALIVQPANPKLRPDKRGARIAAPARTPMPLVCPRAVVALLVCTKVHTDKRVALIARPVLTPIKSNNPVVKIVQ